MRLRSGALPGSVSTTERNARLGSATTTRSASSTGASAIVVAATPARSTSRRKRGLWPVALIAAASSAFRIASVTSKPRSASSRENPVPHEPPPTTTAHVHERRRKSIATGMPSIAYRARSSFSTQ